MQLWKAIGILSLFVAIGCGGSSEPVVVTEQPQSNEEVLADPGQQEAMKTAQEAANR